MYYYNTYVCMCVYIYIYIHMMASRECLGHHRKGTPGIGTYHCVLNVG